MAAALVVCLMCHELFQFVKTNPHLPSSPNSSQTYLSAHSRSKRGVVLTVRVSQSVLLESAAVRMSLKSVCWKESSDVFVVQNWYHRELLYLPDFEKILRSRQQRKPPQMASLLVINNPQPSMFVPRLEAVTKSQPLSASVRRCAPSLPATILLF